MKTVALFLVFLSLCAVSFAAEDDGPALFDAYCRPCHDGNGDGKTAASQRMVLPDLRSSQVQKLTDEDLFQRIGNGAHHKQYPHTFLKKGMTEAQVREVIAYIRTFKAK
jgi:mono/diheme cytochrome c family protein